MISMGLDISTCTGICVLEDGEVIMEKVVTFPKKTGFQRVQAIADVILTDVLVLRPDVVMVEGYAYGNANTLATLVTIGAVVRWALYANDVLWYDVPPTSLKKYMGKGNLTKDEVRLAVYKKWGYEHKSNDVVDAYVLARMGEAQHGSESLLQGCAKGY